MNELNYASLEASKKLVDAGIVLETEFYWCKDESVGWYLRDESTYSLDVHESIPAPCFTEVWRELPEEITYKERTAELYLLKMGGETICGYDIYNDAIHLEQNVNPTDALIELLVWVKGAGK